jgi:hypothetical protein
MTARAEDDWQKKKDCAAQAEKWEKEALQSPDISYDHHYSPKYDRCYVRTTGAAPGAGGRDLYDAFESHSADS